MSKIKELNERYAALTAEMNAITAAVETRSESTLTDEESKNFAELRAKRDKVTETLRAFEEMERDDMRNASAKVAERKDTNNVELEERAFIKYVANKELTAEERAALTMSNSGAIVPNSIIQDVVIGLQGTHGILSAIDLKYTDDSATMTFPYIISSMALQKVAIGGSNSEGEAQWKGLQLTANDFKLPTIPVSRTLMLAGGVDARAALVELFTELIGAGLSSKIISTGDNTNDFKSIVSTVKSATATASNAITYADILNLKAKVKAPYNQIGRASFVMASSTKDALIGLVDKNGRPLYIESMSAGVPDKLFGYPVVIDDAMPEIAAQANVMLFGDMKAYKARIVRGIEVATYDESKYREQGCVGMQAFVTGDGRLMYEDGKIEPIAMLAMAKA
ncbi:MAG: phage major capsid protein [Paludibacteraceae bacterium]|nr:phage major capsid protein [Paludibacteraceae bacterium]